MILITGATGCVGSALLANLLARGETVRCLVRTADAAEALRRRGAEAVVGDLLDPGSLRELTRGVHAVYHLVHMAGLQPFSREETPLAADRRAFRNLVEEMNSEAVAPRLIYVGGLAGRTDCFSIPTVPQPPLVDAIRTSGLPYTILLTSMVVAANSAPFRLAYTLVAGSRLVPLPRWSVMRTQPIALADLVGYLVDCLAEPAMAEDTFEVGGAEPLTIEEALRTIERVYGLRRRFIRLPLAANETAALLLRLRVRMSRPMIDALLANFATDSICRDTRIHQILPRSPLAFEESVRASAVPQP